MRPIQATVGFGGNERNGIGEQLRYAMSHFPSGVAVLATRARGRVEAITLNSFISVSLDPPLVLVSIARTAFILPNLEPGAAFTISALREGQSRVASMIVDRVPDLAKMFDDSDIPALQDALFSLSCTSDKQHEAGDHVLIVARVNAARIGEAHAPLVYHQGRYRAL